MEPIEGAGQATAVAEPLAPSAPAGSQAADQIFRDATPGGAGGYEDAFTQGNNPVAPADGQPATEGGDQPAAQQQAPAFDWDSDANPFKAKFSELEGTVKALQDTIAKANQPDPAEVVRAETERLEQLGKTLQLAGLTQDEYSDITSMYQKGRAFTLAEEKLSSMARDQFAFGLAVEHLPPTATIAQLQEFVKGISPYNDVNLMREAAQLRKTAILTATRDSRSSSGAERTESGGAGTLTGQAATDVTSIINRIAEGRATEQDYALYDAHLNRQRTDGAGL